jgi:hypothetical protein
MFAVATQTTISCSLGRRHRQVPSLSFLDVYADAFLVVYNLDVYILVLHVPILFATKVVGCQFW